MAETIWVFFGLIATGKSTVAQGWAGRHHLNYYNSDRVRKRLAGVEATSKHKVGRGEGIYSEGYTARTYDAMLELAEKEVEKGDSVVLDASYRKRTERDRLRTLAARLDVRIIFVYCICPEDVVQKRLALRNHDPEAVSDGRWEIYKVQRKEFEPPDELSATMLVSLETDRSLEELLDQLDESYEVL